MTRRLLDYDPIRGLTTWMEATGDKFVITHEQDVDHVLDQNKRAANDDEKTTRGIKQDWWKYASVPAIVEIQWLQKYGVNMSDPSHKRKIFELLNHPDYRYLKTTSKVHTINVE